MLTYEQTLPVPAEYFSFFSCSPENVLYFDIETTGFSPYSSYLYLIGCGYLKNGVPTLRQWFSEGFQEEADVLKAFLSFCTEQTLLVHFNGITFDIPYLLKKSAQYEIEFSLPCVSSYDVFKMISTHKNVFGLSHCKQKDIEMFLGINREDCFDGGQLIPVYTNYLARAKYERIAGKNLISVPRNSGLPSIPTETADCLLRRLLLHNAEDIEGLILISVLLPMIQMIEGSVPYDESLTVQVRKNELLLTIPYPVISEQFEIRTDFELFSIHLHNKTLELHIPYLFEELKYYLPDYKDYYYLPTEDTAIHKSVADTVAKPFRKQATAATCYLKKEGAYLMQISEQFTPFFRRRLKDKISYFEPSVLKDQPKEVIWEYVRNLIKSIT